MTLVAIHQPNFLPWLGFFDKMRRADVFVLLDSVQLQKTAGSWTNRVCMLVGGRPAWVTVPLVRPRHGTQRIDEALVSSDPRWREKLVRTIQSAYGRAPCFDAVGDLLFTLVRDPHQRLADYNATAIGALAGALGLVPGTRIVRASDLGSSGTATGLLVDIVRRVGGDAYLPGGGAAGYQDNAAFAAAGIALAEHDFEHPRYPQRGVEEFVPGLSVVDALATCGFDGVRALLDGVPERR